MATAPTTPTSPGTVDLSTGRLKPLTEEARRARSQALARWIAEVPEADATDTEEIGGKFSAASTRLPCDR